MAKRGRKPIEGVERGENGKIKTATYAAVKAAEKAELERTARDVAKWARMAAIIRDLAIDPRMGSVCGRMLLIERPRRLTAKEFAASVRLAEVLDDYDHLVLGVKRAAQAQDVNKAVGISCGGGALESDIKGASARWMAVQGVMGAAGLGCASATMALVREDAWENRLDLAVAGLRALAHHWKITEVTEARIKRAIDEAFNGPSLRQLEAKYAEAQEALADAREKLRVERMARDRVAA